MRAVDVERYDAIVVRERPVTAGPGEPRRGAGRVPGWNAEPDEATQQLLRRARFAGVELDLPASPRRRPAARRALADVRHRRGAAVGRRSSALNDGAPESLTVPSGRSTPLDYREDGAVTASVKLQELFGLAETPRVGPHHEPVTIELLAPNGRPVQTTRDLRSFWERTYPEVRKELRGRYPRHPWPDDPWTATPTHRTVRRR